MRGLVGRQCSCSFLLVLLFNKGYRTADLKATRTLVEPGARSQTGPRPRERDVDTSRFSVDPHFDLHYSSERR